ncbi:50S ribosomal protein L15 [Candidatus Woesearchaeota archaeon]|nr:50S ribosomal protein L15 [Candidatus Woesearchaeota archaeon]
MVVNKRKRKSRRRGSTTHGCGSMKKRRGAGNRGGRGMAGTGKKGDAKKPSIWKNQKYFGKHGFKKKGVSKPTKAVNLNYFEEKLEKLLAKKLIKKEDGFYVIDIKDLGFNKVLGSGRLTKKYRITSPSFSKKAAEKIKAAGGEAIETEKSEPKKKEEKQTAEKTPQEEENEK